MPNPEIKDAGAKNPHLASSVQRPWLDHQEVRLPAIDRAMSLFEFLAKSQRGFTLSEISRKLEMPKSTTHYMIHTLIARGYIQRGSERHYVLGLRFADVASASAAEASLQALTMPYLREIAASLHLTATAAVRRGAEAVIIAKVQAVGDHGGGAWVGRHIDLHCTSQGKVVISMMSDKEIDALFAGRELARFTGKTISSVSALKVHLAQVRANRFATNDEEHVVGVRAVAIPLLDPTGSVIAALSVRGSSQDIPASRLATLGQQLIVVARDVTAQLHG